MARTNNEEYFFGSILLLANKLQVWGDDLLDDITLKQWFLLMLISKMENKNPTVKEVTKFIGTSRQNVKKMLEYLATEGYVKLCKSQTDARALNVCLTQKTFEYFRANEQKGADAVNGLFSKVSDNELEAAIHVTDKLLFALEKSEDEEK